MRSPRGVTEMAATRGKRRSRRSDLARLKRPLCSARGFGAGLRRRASAPGRRAWASASGRRTPPCKRALASTRCRLGAGPESAARAQARLATSTICSRSDTITPPGSSTVTAKSPARPSSSWASMGMITSPSPATSKTPPLTG